MNNNLSGKGSYEWAEGKRYEGQWIENMMHGFGNLTLSDGTTYEGQFKQDKKDG